MAKLAIKNRKIDEIEGKRQQEARDKLWRKERNKAYR